MDSAPPREHQSEPDPVHGGEGLDTGNSHIGNQNPTGDFDGESAKVAQNNAGKVSVAKTDNTEGDGRPTVSKSIFTPNANDNNTIGNGIPPCPPSKQLLEPDGGHVGEAFNNRPETDKDHDGTVSQNVPPLEQTDAVAATKTDLSHRRDDTKEPSKTAVVCTTITHKNNGPECAVPKNKSASASSLPEQQQEIIPKNKSQPEKIDAAISQQQQQQTHIATRRGLQAQIDAVIAQQQQQRGHIQALVAAQQQQYLYLRNVITSQQAQIG